MRRRPFIDAYRLAEWGSLAIALAVAAYVVSSDARQRAALAEHRLVENRLKLSRARDQLEDFLGHAETYLAIVAAHGDVTVLTDHAVDYLRKTYHENLRRHHLSGVFVAQPDDEGTYQAVLELAQGYDTGGVLGFGRARRLEGPASSLVETQRQHARRFQEDARLGTLLSREMPLADGVSGLVLSTPIRSDGRLIGVVSGTVRSADISVALERGGIRDNMVVLANDAGNVFGCTDLPEGIARWFRERFEHMSASNVFVKSGDLLHVEAYTGIYSRIVLLGDPNWYIASFQNGPTAAALQEVATRLSTWATPGGMLLLGTTMVVLCRSLRRRTETQTLLDETNRRLVASLQVEKRLVCDLERARNEAQLATEAKSAFLANMSHEIRTPMTAILGFAEGLRDPSLSHIERTEAINTIHRNGHHLLRVINDILDLSKIEAGQMTVERICCSLRTVVAEVASLMNVRAAAKGLAFTVESEGPVPEFIQTDPTRLRQVLINLVGNAIKFTSSGSVRLVTRLMPAAQGGSSTSLLVFDVIDTGVGMDAGQCDRLFHPFTQADASTTRRFGGTGLGLTISRRMAELLGGCLEVVRTAPAEGTQFRVTIDVGPTDPSHLVGEPGVNVINVGDLGSSPSCDALPFGPGAGPACLPQGCRVLLAEDGPDNQRLITFVLRKAGAEVTVVANGSAAVDFALSARDRGRPYDVILMDLQMPVLDGYEATQQLREKGYPGVIIALTAHAMIGHREKGLRAGCDEYATKPIDRVTLIRTINQTLQAAAAVHKTDAPDHVALHGSGYDRADLRGRTRDVSHT